MRSMDEPVQGNDLGRLKKTTQGKSPLLKGDSDEENGIDRSTEFCGTQGA